METTPKDVEEWLGKGARAGVSPAAGHAFSSGTQERAEGGAPISARERQLIELVAQGFENREIAKRMFLSANTVRNHLHSIFNKLHLSDRLEIALWRAGIAAQNEPFAGQDRRQAPRFEVWLPLRYQVLDGAARPDSGTGRLMNMSSTGVRFTGPANLSCGVCVRLSIDWPVLLNGVRPLQLAIVGRVVRRHESSAAVSVGRCEFRTRPARIEAA